MRKKILPWAIFLACLLFLSLAATPYSKTADALLITVRLTLLLVLSILLVRERWRNGRTALGKEPQQRNDVGDDFLQRCCRWYRGEG